MSRSDFIAHVEREYANDDGVHWEDGAPFIHQTGRVTWLEEEWDIWRAAYERGQREMRERAAGCVGGATDDGEAMWCEAIRGKIRALRIGGDDESA